VNEKKYIHFQSRDAGRNFTVQTRPKEGHWRTLASTINKTTVSAVGGAAMETIFPLFLHYGSSVSAQLHQESCSSLLPCSVPGLGGDARSAMGRKKWLLLPEMIAELVTAPEKDTNLLWIFYG